MFHPPYVDRQAYADRRPDHSEESEEDSEDDPEDQEFFLISSNIFSTFLSRSSVLSSGFSSVVCFCGKLMSGRNQSESCIIVTAHGATILTPFQNFQAFTPRS